MKTLPKSYNEINSLKATVKAIRMTKDRQLVSGIRCGKNHSGNDTLSGPTNRHYQCCGCGTFYTAEEVLRVQSGPVSGQKGQGGIYRVA